MTTALEKTLQSLSKQPLTEGELAMGVQYFAGAVKCLLKMRMEVLREGGNINESINQGAGVTISPVAFLVINKGEVSVKYICEGSESSAERIIGMVPDVVNKVGDIVNKFNGDKKDDKEDSVFVED